MNILIASYYYPPLNRMGSHRPFFWAKTFAEEGEQVSIATTKKNSFEGPLDLQVSCENAHEISYGGLSGAISGMRLPVLALKIARKTHLLEWSIIEPIRLRLLMPKNDIVISSFGPLQSILFGVFYKLLGGAKFLVIDFRDLYSENPYAKKSWFGQCLSRFIERLCISQADLVVVTSSGSREKLNMLYPKKPVLISYNGFSDSATPLLCKMNESNWREGECINLLHAGTVYAPLRDPTPVFEALSDPGLRNLEICITFLGDRVAFAEEKALEYQVSDVVSLPGQCSNEESKALQSRSDFLILISSSGSEGLGIIPAKVFEYMISGTPIMGVGFTSSDELGELIESVGAGKAFGCDKTAIRDELNRFAEHGVPEWYSPEFQLIRQYSREHQAKMVLAIFRELVGSE